MLAIWAVSVFYDTRKIWPYAVLRLKGTEPILSKETFSIAALLLILVSILVEGFAMPFFR